jgi:hypothetical protein
MRLLDKKYLLDLLNLERKQAITARVLAATGLFVGGAVVGAAVALLVTPKTGEDVRHELKDLAVDLKEKLVDHRINGQAESTTAQGANFGAPAA